MTLPDARIFVTLYAVCLAGATCTHLADLWRLQGEPYPGVPASVSLYWKSLTVIDLLAVLLLFWRPRAGLLLTVLVIVSDVIVNSAVMYRGIADAMIAANVVGVVQAQTAFLGLVLGSAPLLWQALPWIRARPRARV